jgi:hypothetical protein
MSPPLDAFNNQQYQFATSYDGLPGPTEDEFDPNNASLHSISSNASIPKTSRIPPNKGVDTLEGLRALPVVRQIPWKEGKELTEEQITKQTARVQTRGAFLLVTRGQVRNPQCNRCVTGTGRFSLCVSLDGWFKGACATCEMATRGNLCSLRKEWEGKILCLGWRKLWEPLTDLGAEVNGHTPKTKRSVTTKPTLQELESPVSDHDDPVSLKRKRASDVPTTAPAAPSYVSPYQAEEAWSQGNIQTYPPAATSFSISQQRNVPVESQPSLLDYAYQKQHPPNGTKQAQPPPRAQRDSQEPASRTSRLGDGYNAYTGAKASEGSSEGRREDKLSPSVQLQQSAARSWQDYNNKLSGSTAAIATESQPTEASEIALIDTLPRKRQKQIFGIIGGIQSGIRNVRQQTEDLQKQLDLLQEALGIGTDADDNL